MLSSIARLAKRLNWARHGWSTARDREFHNALFASEPYDPFNASYPGYLTIRRFADLAVQSIRVGDAVIDLGCGPGEITCELARRRPDSHFVGVDHSSEAVARAERLAANLGLTNVRFERNDLEQYQPRQHVGLVTMFDAFHHLLDPGGFVRRVGPSCDRFFLIEPAGNWLGQWQKTLDVDWIAEAIFTIRDRLEWQFGIAPPTRHESPSPTPTGEPIERRYSIEDFSQWFAGYGVDIRGTVAGLELYGATPYATSTLREDIGGCIYNLVVDIEATLRRHDLDLAAKHWAISAERGLSVPTRRVPSLSTRVVQRPLVGPYDVRYSAFEGPTEARIGSVIDAAVRVANRSWRVWDSLAEEGPVFVSYHWLDAKGLTVVHDGLRSPLPRPLAPGDDCDVGFRIQCPDQPGRYTLAIDLIHERTAWFSSAGSAPLRIRLRVVR